MMIARLLCIDLPVDFPLQPGVHRARLYGSIIAKVDQDATDALSGLRRRVFG